MKKQTAMFGRKKAARASTTPFADICYRFARNRAAMFGLIVVVVIVALAVFANWICDYQADALDVNPSRTFLKPNADNWFGTDHLGRDLFARIIFGARYSLSFGLVCTVISVVCGSLIGAAAAFAGGKTDNIIMRALDSIMCIPAILLTLSLVSVMGTGLPSLMISISFGSVPGFARLVRSVVLTVARMDYIEAAKASGVGSLRIIVGHILPNAVGTIIVNATMNIAGLIIAAASLSYIGMGIQPPAPEWGSMLSEATVHMRTYPYLVIFPGLAIVITALAFNLVGDGLADALDPRMKD